jgi:DNA-binding NarL/FixJ family response regulator
VCIHDQRHRKCLADALAATGHFPAIEFAASAEEAQESLHDHPADVFLIDWGLPHERALELTKRFAITLPSRASPSPAPWMFPSVMAAQCSRTLLDTLWT